MTINTSIEAATKIIERECSKTSSNEPSEDATLMLPYLRSFMVKGVVMLIILFLLEI
jgi:hypothetical protein